jgi:hypothetical protein
MFSEHQIWLTFKPLVAPLIRRPTKILTFSLLQKLTLTSSSTDSITSSLMNRGLTQGILTEGPCTDWFVPTAFYTEILLFFFQQNNLYY